MRNIYLAILLGMVFLFAGCKKKTTEEPQPRPHSDRTVLIYLAGNNSLWRFVDSDLQEMTTGMLGIGGNLIVYVAKWDANPQLIRIHANGTREVIETYEKENSVAPTVLSRVIDRTMELFPAKSYGLVLWSHGDGWRPHWDQALYSFRYPRLWQKDPDALPTKWFGQDVPANSYMEIPQLAQVLPKNRKFDFLLFDACLMSSIEAVYDLRDAAKYIIASPNEVMADGFPYMTVVPTLFNETLRLEQTCDAFMTYYRNSQQPWASVALLQTDQLEALAAATKTYLATTTPDESVAEKVQHLELMDIHLYYDLDDYLVQLKGDSAAYKTFRNQLLKTVVHSDHTPKIYSAFGSGNHEITLRAFCGLSTYIIRSDQELARINEAYRNTAWAKAIGLDKE